MESPDAAVPMAVQQLAPPAALDDMTTNDAFCVDAAVFQPARDDPRRGHRRSASTPVEEVLGEFYLERDASLAGAADGGGAAGGAGDGVQGLAGSESALGDAETSEQMQLDPKRAKRILANRLSAARSKERKQQHAQDLERRASELEAELAATGNAATQLEHQVQLLMRERKDLEAHLEALEQHKATHDATRGVLEHAMQAQAQQLAANAAWSSGQMQG